MGTRVHVELWHTDAEQGKALVAAVMDEMRRIEQAYSPYIEDSELSLLNRDAPRGSVRVSDELFDLLTRSAAVSELTGGAFDVTYASVGRYYDYREREQPDAATFERAVDAIDYRHVVLDPVKKTVRFDDPRVYVDLGGIAKGYAVDTSIAQLLAAGVSHASVSAGGDSRIVGDRRGKPWTVGVRNPRNENEMSVILPLIDTAVSTSGDYERFFEEDGVRFHHILDPTTGRSADGAMSVTILGSEATLTDALSTSVFVLGPERGIALIDTLPGVDAIVIDSARRFALLRGARTARALKGSHFRHR